MSTGWTAVRGVLFACATAIGALLAPGSAHAAGCEVVDLQKSIGKITVPLATLKPSAAAAQAAPKAADLEALAARARTGALDDGDANHRIACARLAVDANLALSLVPAKRAAAASALVEMTGAGVDECDKLGAALGPNVTDCAVLRRQHALAPARRAIEDLAAVEPKKVDAASPNVSPETWRAVADIMRSLQRTVQTDWKDIDDPDGRNRLGVLCSLVSAATTKGVTDWRPGDTPSLDDRVDSFERYYHSVLAEGAAQLGLKAKASVCSDPASPACILARRTAVTSICIARSR